MQWLRWWHGTVNDPKFSWVARKAGCNVATVIAVWAALLEHASQEEERGTLGGFDPESYDCTLGLDDGTCQRVMDAMRGKGLLEVDRVAMWESRQNKPDKSAERTQRWREKRKTQSSEEESKTDSDTDTEVISLRCVTEPSPTVTSTRKNGKGMGLPDDFGLTEDRTAYATERLPKVNAPELLSAFRDYHTNKGTLARDWDASWRTWVRNATSLGYPMLAAAMAQPQKVTRYDSRGRVINE